MSNITFLAEREHEKEMLSVINNRLKSFLFPSYTEKFKTILFVSFPIIRFTCKFNGIFLT